MTRTEVDVIATLRAAGCVFAEDEAGLLVEAATGADLDALVARRCAGEPLEHLLGVVEFAGRRFRVAPGVFVPRRRTELLAAEAASRVRAGDVVVELCCGAGVVGAVIGAQVPSLILHAADVDARAATCARANLPAHAAVHVGDLFDALPQHLEGRVDVLVANAPYVPTGEIATMPPEARDHEPRPALDGGADGMDVQRRIIAGARTWLRAGGHLLTETSTPQAAHLTAIAAAAGLTPTIATDPERDATVLVARRDQPSRR